MRTMRQRNQGGPDQKKGEQFKALPLVQYLALFPVVFYEQSPELSYQALGSKKLCS
jgi:hypothetical protein